MVTADTLAKLPAEERTAMLAALTDEEAAVLLFDWTVWAREKQLPPENFYVWLLLAGRGFGKTRAITELVIKWAKDGHSPIALIGQTKADVRDTLVELGESSILKISPPWFRPAYEPSKRRLTWPNGVQGVIYSGDEPDQLRGPQHCFVAGTMIATPTGEKPIERLRNGDYVLTRLGERRISNCFSRFDKVGKIKFSNGAELVATAQHPVLQLQRWTRISELQRGAIVCTGENLPMVIYAAIKAGERYTITGGYGNSILGLFHQDFTSIIRTAIRKTIASKILQCCVQSSTLISMMSKGKEYLLNALIVALNLNVYETIPAHHFALVARTCGNTKGTFKGEKTSKYVRCVVEHSTQSTMQTSVASVVSTWEDVGEAEVFNIEVSDPPEYIANGIIVHNSKAVLDELAKFRYPELTWQNLMMGLRVGKQPQVAIATTPRPIKLLKELVRDSRVKVTRGHTIENRANLAPQTVGYLLERYQGTKLGRQELAGELLDKIEGLVYDAFDAEQCVVSRFAIPQDWPRYVGHDFGRINDAVLWYAQEPATGFFYLYRVYKGGQGITERVADWQELSKGEPIRRRVGGNHQEEQIRQGYALAGWPIAEPAERRVETQVLLVNELHKGNKIYIFSDLHEYLEEKTSYSWEVDKEENFTGKIHNESQYHFMAAERYLMSEFKPVAVAGEGISGTIVRGW